MSGSVGTGRGEKGRGIALAPRCDFETLILLQRKLLCKQECVSEFTLLEDSDLQAFATPALALPTCAKMGLTSVKLIIHIVGFVPPRPRLPLSEYQGEVTEVEGS